MENQNLIFQFSKTCFVEIGQPNLQSIDYSIGDNFENNPKNFSSKIMELNLWQTIMIKTHKITSSIKIPFESILF